jgi:hypothetical protein
LPLPMSWNSVFDGARRVLSSIVPEILVSSMNDRKRCSCRMFRKAWKDSRAGFRRENTAPRPGPRMSDRPSPNRCVKTVPKIFPIVISRVTSSEKQIPRLYRRRRCQEIFTRHPSLGEPGAESRTARQFLSGRSSQTLDGVPGSLHWTARRSRRFLRIRP